MRTIHASYHIPNTFELAQTQKGLQLHLNLSKKSWIELLLLITAGEAIFILPFVIPRIFRFTVLDLFEIDNTQLGWCYSIYGLVAMASYVFGGPLADRFSPKKLMALGLWLTALGGVVYSFFPPTWVQQILYGYWGFTTIFLFWAPMIKTTRIWGGAENQGKAFGWLDGGRGLTGALFGVLGVSLFSSLLVDAASLATLDERQSAFQVVILSANGFIAAVGFLVWFFLQSETNHEYTLLEKLSLAQIKPVLKLPSVWLLAVVILSAYVAYKVTDITSLFAKEVMQFDEVKAAGLGTFLMFLRPVAGIGLGFFVDQLHVTKALLVSLLLTLVGAILFATGVLKPNTTLLFVFSVVVLGMGVYASRALYYAVMQKGQIPLHLTGAAVGVISLVGYTPDVFVGPITGYFLDNFQGFLGHQLVFLMLMGFTFIGLVTGFIFLRKYP